MRSIKQEKIEKICVILLFVLIFLIGLLVFRDYRCSTDEFIQREHSIRSYRTLARSLFHREFELEPYTNGVSLWDYPFKYYGVAIQLPLVFVEDMYSVSHVGAPMPLHLVFAMRHLSTFLLYYLALICFYFLCKHLFSSRWLGIASVLMIYTFGRFFAHSYFNIKDMTFASLSMIYLLCTERVFSTNRKTIWCILLAFSGALLVSSRIVGALYLVFTIVAMIIQDICANVQRKSSVQQIEKPALIKLLLPYFLICLAYPIWIAVTPASWNNPIAFSLGYIREFSNYTAFFGRMCFRGARIEISQNCPPPRDYLITWMAITIPIVNQLLCILGLGVFLARMIRPNKQPPQSSIAFRYVLWIAFLVLIGTFFYQFICRPIMYNGWRQAFYLYPLVILFAVYAVRWVWLKAREYHHTWIGVAVSLALACSIGYNAWHIASTHPNQCAIYNSIGKRVSTEYERDYWRLSYGTLMTWMLENIPERPILLYDVGIFDGTHELIDSYSVSTPSVRAAFKLCPEQQDAEYAIVCYNFLCGVNYEPVEGFDEIHSIWVDGAKISSVVKRKPTTP